MVLTKRQYNALLLILNANVLDDWKDKALTVIEVCFRSPFLFISIAGPA